LIWLGHCGKCADPPIGAAMSAATDAGFLIEKLIEPVPAETMRCGRSWAA
jgi:hypothetical protein